MFDKIQSLKLKSSVSAFNYGFVYNYNKQSDLHMIGCLDVDAVNLVKFKLISNDTIEQLDSIQIKINPIDDSTQFCLIEFHCFKFMDFDLFCLISSSGLHIFNDNLLTKPIFTYAIKNTINLLGSINLKELTFNGVACLDSLLFLGSSTGAVIVFEMNVLEIKSEQEDLIERTIRFEFKECLKQHHYSITFINSATDLVKDINNQFLKVHRLSISDALGNISIWHLDNSQLKFILQFAGFNNYHCVSTLFFEDLLLASYSSGHIRLFSLVNIDRNNDKSLLCEVSAHARPITSMNIDYETGLLITTAEDTFARVWKLKPDADCYIKQKYCYSIKNCLLVSSLFLGENSKFFSVIAYDENEAFVFKKSARI